MRIRLSHIAGALLLLAGAMDAAPSRAASPCSGSPCPTARAQYTDGSGNATNVTPTNPLPTTSTQTGNTNADYSGNAESVPPAGYSLLATVPATPSRNEITIQNRSTDVVKIVIDDGNATAGTVSVISLGAAAASGGQGGGYSDNVFKGRARIYVPTANVGTDIVYASQG